MVELNYVVWILTGRCSLSCPHCYAYRFRFVKEMSLAEKIRLAKEMAEYGVDHVNITGGESTLLKDLEAVLWCLHDHGVSTSIVTNGIHIDERIARTLSRTDTYAFVSVDGDRETHEMIRGPGTWERVVQGLRLLREYGVMFSTVMAISKVNYTRVTKYIDFASSMGASSAIVIPVMPFGRARITGLYVTKDIIAKVINEINNCCADYCIAIGFWCLPFAKALVRAKLVGSESCRKSLILDIDPSGNVLLCDVLDIVIESVSDKPFRLVMESLDRNELVRSLVGRPRLPPECLRCSFRELCRGGCFARSFIKYGSFYRPDPLCPIASKLSHDLR